MANFHSRSFPPFEKVLLVEASMEIYYGFRAANTGELSRKTNCGAVS